jgi:hypothetical protein
MVSLGSCYIFAILPSDGIDVLLLHRATVSVPSKEFLVYRRHDFFTVYNNVFLTRNVSALYGQEENRRSQVLRT